MECLASAALAILPSAKSQFANKAPKRKFNSDLDELAFLCGDDEEETTPQVTAASSPANIDTTLAEAQKFSMSPRFISLEHLYKEFHGIGPPI